jgi:DNA-directed RNA polymerase specialized sigma24 family protein
MQKPTGCPVSEFVEIKIALEKNVNESNNLIFLKRLKGYSSVEIGKELNISPQTVFNRLKKLINSI